jgi:hypothetical protein
MVIGGNAAFLLRPLVTNVIGPNQLSPVMNRLAGCSR